MDKTITITKKDFICWPYIKCPKCWKDTFGVDIIMWWTKKYYSRTCINCWHSESYELPEITKKVVYLDQFAISNMMKAINPENKSFGKQELEKRKKLFDKIDVLCKKQAIICPYSDVHEEESVVTNLTIHQAYSDLKKMYEYLWRGCSFMDDQTLERFQVVRHFEDRLLKKQHTPKISRKEIFHNDIISERQGQIRIDVDSKFMINHMDEINRERNAVSEWVKCVFEKIWQKEKRNFDYRCKEETLWYWRGTYSAYINSIIAYAKVEQGVMSIEEWMWSILGPSSIIITNIKHILERNWINDEWEKMKKIQEYFSSPTMNEVPFINIRSSLWADLAIQANNWRKNPPNRWESNDIKVIALYSPYCDAMLIDSKMFARLNQNPLKDKLKEIWYWTVFFSNSDDKIDKFIEYLEEIERSVSSEQEEAIKGLYWDIKSYSSMYIKKS